MSGQRNGQTAIPAGAVIVGQPFTPITMSIPVNVTLRCNCGGADTLVSIVLSAPASCGSCQRIYGAAYDPTRGGIQVSVGGPATPEVIS